MKRLLEEDPTGPWDLEEENDPIEMIGPEEEEELAGLEEESDEEDEEDDEDEDDDDDDGDDDEEDEEVEPIVAATVTKRKFRWSCWD